MRFKHFLGEMTIRAGNLRKGLEPLIKEYQSLIISQGEHIGDVDEYKVYKSYIEGMTQFALYKEDVLATLFVGDFKTDKYLKKYYLLIQMVTAKEFSGNHLSAKLLVFLKTRHYTPVVFNEIHSKDTTFNLRKIAKKVPFLQVKWFNIKTGEIDEYDPEKDEQDKKHVMTISRTDWRILIETKELGYYQNSWDDYHKFPIFNKENMTLSEMADITRNYDTWIIE